MTTDEPDNQIAVLKHRRFSRWMHWINFPVLTIMIWSGLRIYWADIRDPFGFGVGLVGWHWFDFFPDSVYETLGLRARLAKGMAWHFTFGWLFTINGIMYALLTWRSREWRHLLPDRHSFRDAISVTKHDLFFWNRKSNPLPPQGRYNGAQRLSYSFILFLGGLEVLTGFAIYKPTQANFLTTLFGGYEWARGIHFSITVIFLVFFVVHIVQVGFAGWRNFMSMVTGYELVDVDTKHEAETTSAGSADDQTDDASDEELSHV